jgi:hypothetical protein
MALEISANAAPWQMKQPPLATPWTSLVNTNTPLPEYPRPQMVRSNWLNLNGVWQFEPGATNTDPVPTNQTLSGNILVPFPMESAISGVMAYNAWSWYRTLFTVPTGWSGQRIILHLDAVTWQAQVYVNGHSAGIHSGGYDPFSYDITSYLTGSGAQELIVQVWSPEDNGSQPRGKQTLYPGGIMYTSSSGIWQPVWLEPAGASGVQNLVIIPDIDNSRLRLTVNTYASSGVTVSATVLSNATVIQTASGNPDTELDIPISNPELWTPNNPFLYNLQVSVMKSGATNDSVTSYFGMRKISANITAGIPRIYLNNQPIFGMGPLDQGYWPDGIYTAPTDAALEFDLQEIKSLGFNTIRKHEKVERQRWYYWADVLGLMVWQDMPTCNSYTDSASPPAVNPLQFTAELSALVTNHWNSPSIIMWDIFNEDQGEAGSSDGVGQTNTPYLVNLVKGLDSSRLVNQASGGAYFGVGDVFDNHSYPAPGDPTSTTQAAVDGEFGGIGFLVAGHLWNPAAASTAYIAAPSEAEIAPLYDPFIDDLVAYKSGGLNAGIYTQITDVENECDGLLTYDRLVKADPTRIAYSNEKAITGQIDTAIDDNIIANTLTVPADYIGYWPLDETSGTIAVDASGNGNNGTVASATWSTNGRIKGCLNFNGVNNYVGVYRDVVDDFSIAFWVKTTATGGTGQWYNGDGLVDGSVGAGANDFGTALVGKLFAFGVGNPDTTLVSSTPVNDGLWHYCVATRAQSTGAMQLYVDGVLQASGAGSTNPLTVPPYLRFGGIQSGGGFLNGSLDEIKIYDRALGNLEIAALYGDGASAPAAPTNLTCVTGDGQVELNWWEVSFATSYNVSRSATGGGPYTLIANVSTPSYTDTNVVNGATYYYVVSSVDSAGAGPNSSAVVSGTILQHRYSFVTDASDSVGGANGTLEGSGAAINNGLSMPGTGTSGNPSGYVLLPNGIVSGDTSVTIECWVKQNAAHEWAEVWDFGDSGGTYNFGLIPSSSTGNMRVAFTSPATGEIDINAPKLPTGSEEYVCVTYAAASTTANLYLNGVLDSGSGYSGTVSVPVDDSPGGFGITTGDFFGCDEYGGDDQFDGTLYELRIWNGAVSPLYITLSQLAGPKVLITNLTPVSVSVTVNNTTMTAAQTQQAAVSANFPQASSSSVSLSAAIPAWTSSNPGVLTVNASGLVTAVGSGSATISANIGGTIGTITSITVALTAPAITQQPVSANQYAGGSAVLDVTATGGDLSYQWYLGTNTIPGATNATLTLTSLAVNNSGNYSVLISNPLGSTNSAAATLSVSASTLVHRWSFNETSGSIAHDSVGVANGTLMGGVYFASNAVQLPGGAASAGNYVQFPNGILVGDNSVTIEAWLTDNGGVTWAEPWCFGGSTSGPNSGDQTTNYISFIPTSGDGDMRAAFKLLNEEDVVYPNTTMPLNKEEDVVLTYNNTTTTATLYLNGVQVAVNTDINITPADLGNTYNNYLGLDEWDDPLFKGSIDELRIYNGPLTPTDIANNHGAGPNTLVNPGSASDVTVGVTRTGSNVILTWPEGILLQAPSVLGPWTTNYSAVSPYTVETIGAAQFYKILIAP